MVSGIWGKKIGMTQLFSDDKAIPVTVVDIGNWVVTGIKTKERDGYNALQVGCLRKRYIGQSPSTAWMKKPSKYFGCLREIHVDELPENVKVGDSANFYAEFKEGEQVDVFGIIKGRGFAGVVKRWGFRGDPASHGHTMGDHPGSMGCLCAEGKVVKGKRLPGHMGVRQCVIKNLDIIKVDPEGPIVFIKGAIPGYNGSLVFMRKHA